jgi:hypothetical protein
MFARSLSAEKLIKRQEEAEERQGDEEDLVYVVLAGRQVTDQVRRPEDWPVAQ